MEYVRAYHTVWMGDRSITVCDLTPVFVSEAEGREAGDRIEKRLYDIFKKYVS